MLTATDYVPDRQRRQIQAIAHLIMDAIGKHIPDDGNSRKHALYDLFDALEKAGIDIITKEDREAAGLAPRGPKGWTVTELQVMEAKRMEALLRPPPPMIFPAKP
jgi:hypothetical protein